MKRATLILAGISACATAFPALAQQQPQPDQQQEPPVDELADPGAEEEIESIVVTGARPVGSVIGNITPETTFTPRDIQSFGVSSVEELIAELAPQIDSGQGRGGEAPVVLLNGKRISGFREIRDVPTEAIRRVEVLPEEVALKYGYRPNQKVVNVVLRPRFRAFTGELEAAVPTEGGQFSPEAEGSYIGIRDGRRLNLSFDYERSSALYESERGLTGQTPRRPYDLVGNIGSATQGAEIDPALSALLGRPATVVGVPQSAASGQPALADFVPGDLNVSDVGPYRTLLPETDTLELNAVLASTIFGNVSASFNGSLNYSESNSAQGLGTAQITVPGASPYSPFAGDTLLYRYLGEFDPLGQESRDVGGHLGVTLNGALKDWQWTFTGNFDHTNSRTRTERGFDLSGFQDEIDALDPLLNPFAPLAFDQVTGQLVDSARSNSNVGDGELVLTGSFFTLPAGAASTTIKVGGSMQDLNSRSVRSGVVRLADLSRDQGSGQISIDLPIASARRDVLKPLGDLSANFNAGYDELSDFGGLRTLGAGFTWTPIRQVRLIASWSEDEGAPTVQQLGNPLVSTSGVRVFDYVEGETVDITRISGGNPDLLADNRHVFKLGATIKPLSGSELTLTANYTNSRVRDPIASFPTATAAIEAAFPDRFTRDVSGRLLQIDSRSINFARQNNEQLRWGINFSKQLSTPPRPTRRPAQDGQEPQREIVGQGQGQGQGQGDRPAGQPGSNNSGGNAREGRGGGPGGFPGGGFRRGGGGGPQGTRLQLALYHTVHLRNEILTYDGGPVLDLLGGDAINSSGGQARHQVRAQAGLTRNGFGARLSGTWQSGTTVNGGADGRSLRFSDLATLNLRLFANLGQQRALTSKWPFLRGTRVTLSVTNLFNDRLHVTDMNGVTPVSYQPAYLDPLGRSVRLSIRKLFF